MEAQTLKRSLRLKTKTEETEVLVSKPPQNLKSGWFPRSGGRLMHSDSKFVIIGIDLNSFYTVESHDALLALDDCPKGVE
jgi:hypothetical protein